ncbi:hypothetical protein HDU93_003774 [Gonapodya sp. JEL0774]|nr:hypothetical protein HDU93_003774 [Gonapodya sp. JEL0774]
MAFIPVATESIDRQHETSECHETTTVRNRSNQYFEEKRRMARRRHAPASVGCDAAVSLRNSLPDPLQPVHTKSRNDLDTTVQRAVESYLRDNAADIIRGIISSSSNEVAPAALIANQADKVSELELALLDGRRREESLMRQLENLRHELNLKCTERAILQARLSSAATEQERSRHELTAKTAIIEELQERLISSSIDRQRNVKRATECEEEGRRISLRYNKLLDATNARRAPRTQFQAAASTIVDEDADPVFEAETQITNTPTVPAPASSSLVSPQPGSSDTNVTSNGTSIILEASAPSTPSTESVVPPTPPRRGNSAYHTGAAFLNVSIASNSMATNSCATNMHDYPIVYDFDNYSQSSLRDPVMEPQCLPSAEEWAEWDQAHGREWAKPSELSVGYLGYVPYSDAPKSPESSKDEVGPSSKQASPIAGPLREEERHGKDVFS